MKYSSCVIYFLTGTGNSYRAATWIAAIHTNKGINSKLYTKSYEEADYEENERTSWDWFIQLMALQRHGR